MCCQMSTQSLLFAAGLRPTPAQATAVSWILKDGMQHAGKLICSRMGARMDSEPKSWRILADVLYDLGTALEIISPLCPQLFLEVAGLGNFAKVAREWLLLQLERQGYQSVLLLLRKVTLVTCLLKGRPSQHFATSWG